MIEWSGRNGANHMTIIELRKSRLMNAIKKEPLKPGSFVMTYESKDTVASKHCQVCAVGAVMRSVLDKKQNHYNIFKAASASIKDHVSVAPDIYDLECLVRDNLAEDEIISIKDLRTALTKEALRVLNEENSPMGALSFFFEGLCSLKEINGELTGVQLAGIRRTVFVFVRDNYPSKMLINIDGAKPAHDVKVVK